MFDRARRVLELQPDMRICDVEVFEAVASRSAPSDLSTPPPLQVGLYTSQNQQKSSYSRISSLAWK